MVTAYFDDSGTHDQSNVVVWAGVFGTPEQWKALDTDWRAKLKEPSPAIPAKEPIKTFHMHHCFNSTGEFEGWSRTETDFLVHELMQIILKHEISGYGFGVWRPDFDDLVSPDFFPMIGDPEGLCLRAVYTQSVEWVQRYTTEDRISYVFDDRPHRANENKLIFKAIKETRDARDQRPKLDEVTFGSASEVVPLQVADLFAWETYRGCVLLRDTNTHEPMRRPLSQLGESKRFAIQYANRDVISKIVAMAAEESSAFHEKFKKYMDGKAD
jgi:hypothetical protein